MSVYMGGEQKVVLIKKLLIAFVLDRKTCTKFHQNTSGIAKRSLNTRRTNEATNLDRY